jgi:hypothetical protein
MPATRVPALERGHDGPAAGKFCILSITGTTLSAEPASILANKGLFLRRFNLQCFACLHPQGV